MSNYLDDAVIFHTQLNPLIWSQDTMIPGVQSALLQMAHEFQDFLALDDLHLQDITVSGSNAAYSYTPHSDIDLHLVVSIPPSFTQLYTELFDAKKSLYNLTHDQTVKGYSVEFYVQDCTQQVESIGIYSLLNQKWIHVPQRIKPTIDDISIQSKVESYTHRILDCLASTDIPNIKKTWQDVKQMRKSGLAQMGEFSPENLAFKILRTQGLVGKLMDHLITLRDREISMEGLQ